MQNLTPRLLKLRPIGKTVLPETLTENRQYKNNVCDGEKTKTDIHKTHIGMQIQRWHLS